MNCSKGDLARVIPPGVTITCPLCGVPAVIVDPDTLVTCVESDGADGWVVDRPFPFKLQFWHGNLCLIVSGSCTAIRDALLRPIRDPGEHAVDEILERVGAPESLVGVPSEEVTA